MAKKLLVISVTFLLAAVHFTLASSSSSYWGFNCAGGNFTPRSYYSRSLEALAAVLPGRAASSSVLFNSSQAAGPRGEGAAYGIAQCQRDSNRLLCERCITRGLMDARRVCGFSDGAFVFRDLCTVGYCTTELLPWLPHDPSVGRVIRRNDGADVIIIHRKMLQDALHELAICMAVVNRTTTSPQHFATGQKEVNADLNLYAAAQCIPTMTVQDCDGCLGLLFDTLFLSADDLVAGRAATPWCSYRVALHPFFTGHPTLTLPPARSLGNGSLPKAGEKHKHEHSKHTPTWVWITIGALGAVMLVIIIGLACWCRKKKLTGQNNSSGDEHRNEIQCTGKALAVEARPSALDSFQEILKLAMSKEIVLFLDYDGTLSPIVSDPDKAYMPDQMRRVLQEAARCFKTSIVSGRARDKVYQFVGLDEINYAGSHGLDIKLSTATATTSTSSNNSEIVDQRGSYQPAEEHLAAITEVYNSMLRATSMINGATVENNKYCVSVHYRNVAMEDRDTVREVVDEVLKTQGGDLKLTQGKMVFEIRPPTHWNKGDAILYLLEHLGLGDPAKVFPIYIGDDKTDEDAFKVLLDRGVGILVSEASRETTVVYSLRNPSEVMHFLAMLVKGKQQEMARLVWGC